MVDAAKLDSRTVSRPAIETLILAGLAVVGAGVVAGGMRIGGWVDSSAGNEAAWSLWLALLAAQGALWGILLPLLLRAHAALGARVNPRDLVVALTPLVLLLITSDIARSRNNLHSPLPGHFAKVTVLTWIGTGVALVA